MNNLTQEILIFTTNVNSIKAVNKLAPLLNGHAIISKWNFDLEDCDKILRIEASEKISKEVISLLRRTGFKCAELPYEL